VNRSSEPHLPAAGAENIEICAMRKPTGNTKWSPGRQDRNSASDFALKEKRGELRCATLTVALLVILLLVVLTLTTLFWLTRLLLAGLLLAVLSLLTRLPAVLSLLSGLATLLPFLLHIVCHENFLLAKHEPSRALRFDRHQKVSCCKARQGWEGFPGPRLLKLKRKISHR
jgi:hypothetical protein